MKRLLVLLIAIGCSHDKRNELPPETWGVADYASAGLRIDKPWTADDYTSAAATLKRIAVDHRDRLPRFHGTKSGAVFDKLVTDPPDDPGAPIDKRFIAHGIRSEALTELMHVYVPNQYDTPPREWIEITGAEMREAAFLASTSDAFLATFGSDDPSLAKRRDGVAQMRRGYGMMLLGGVYVADQTRIPDDDRIAMLGYVTTTLPALFPQLSADSQQQLRDLLAKEATGFPAGRLRDAAVAAQRALPQ